MAYTNLMKDSTEDVPKKKTPSKPRIFTEEQKARKRENRKKAKEEKKAVGLIPSKKTKKSDALSKTTSDVRFKNAKTRTYSRSSTISVNSTCAHKQNMFQAPSMGFFGDCMPTSPTYGITSPIKPFAALPLIEKAFSASPTSSMSSYHSGSSTLDHEQTPSHDMNVYGMMGHDETSKNAPDATNDSWTMGHQQELANVMMHSDEDFPNLVDLWTQDGLSSVESMDDVHSLASSMARKWHMDSIRTIMHLNLLHLMISSIWTYGRTLNMTPSLFL